MGSKRLKFKNSYRIFSGQLKWATDLEALSVNQSQIKYDAHIAVQVGKWPSSDILSTLASYLTAFLNIFSLVLTLHQIKKESLKLLMWLSELTVCLSWGCCCCNASFFFWGGEGECCDISHAAAAGWTLWMLWHLFPRLQNELIWEFRMLKRDLQLLHCLMYHASVASVELQLAARELCAGTRPGLLQRQLQCNQHDLPRQWSQRGET